MKHLLRPFASSLFILLLAAVVGSSAQAQWTPVTPTPFPAGTIHIVKFLDAFNAPNTGVLGDTNGIWYTTTGGTTPGSWAQATITGTLPISFTNGWVNDISFKDATHGAAIITGNMDPADSGILLTSDGGATWTFDDHAGTPDSGSGIFWNPLNNRLFVSSLDKGLVFSSDNGNTWHPIDNDKDTGNHYTGFAFTDFYHGIVATWGSQQNGFSPTYHWLQTSDGGVTWTRCQMFWESWQPLAIPSSSTYLASTDYYLGSAQPSPMLLRSDNGGYSFANIPSYSPAGDTLTEDVVGDPCDIYAPSEFSLVHMWYSVSDGNIWQMWNSAPIAPIDSRIYASPSTVWSFNGNTLSYAPRPASNAIHILPSDSIAFTKASCGNTSDTVIHIYGCVCANGDILERSGTANLTGGTFTTDNTGWPRTLCVSPSSGEGNPDSIHIRYSPGGVNPAIGNDTIWYMDNGSMKDTIIHLWGNGVVPGITLVNPSFTKNSHQLAFREPACGDTGDCFTIVNTGCSPVTIRHAYISEADTDTCVLQITLPSPLPNSSLTLQPGQQAQVCVNFQGKLVKQTTTASVYFDWQSGSTTGSTPIVSLVGITTSSTHPEFRGLNLSVPNCCYVPDDTEIYFVNSTSCQASITLNGVQFFHADDPNMFSLDTALMLKKGFKSPIFPIQVPPGQFLPLQVRISDCHGGVFHDSIRFLYSFGSGVGACSQAVDGVWDTIMTLRVGSTGPVAPTVSTVNLGWTVNCCDTTEVKALIITPGCKNDTLRSIGFDSAGGDFVIVSSLPTLPLPINGQQTILIRYRHPNSSGSTGKITLTFGGAELNPVSTQDVVQLTGYPCTTSATAPLNSNNVDFGTLPCGQGACDSVLMKGSPCGAVKVGFIQNPSSPFTIESPTTGTLLSAGDSTYVRVCINPTDTGQVSSMVVINITDPNGTVGVPDTLFLTGYLTPPSPSFTVTQLASATICDTSTIDEQFTFTNTGSCYTYVLTGANASDGSKVKTTPNGKNYPDSIPPGGSQTFTVHFDPQGTPGTLNGSITLVDAGGQTITVPYDITVDTCETTGGLHVAMPGNLITTPNCVTGVLVFTVNAGGGSGSVSSTTITGMPRFSLTNTSGGAIPLTDTILFDPNQPGSNAATLTIKTTINGTEHDTTISITGSTVGTKYSARIGVTTPTDSCISPNDTDLKELDVMIYDSIPDALGVDSLSFVLNYNGDLLWNPQNVFGAGWQLVRETPENDGLHITLKYTGSGTGAIAAGQAVIKIKELGALAKILSDTAHVTSPHFNDSAFEVCTLKAIAASGDSNSAPICINAASCPRNILARDMNGTLKAVPVDSLIIIPNPIRQDGTAATLNFHTTVAGAATVEVVNELGTPVSELINGPVIKGDHIVPIITNNLAQGAYFVRITMNGYTIVRKFVLEKE